MDSKSTQLVHPDSPVETSMFSQFGASDEATSLQHFSDKIRQFTPNWFAMTMGNGIVSLVLAALPESFPAQHTLAVSLWCVDIVLYAVFTAMFAARLIVTKRPHWKLR